MYFLKQIIFIKLGTIETCEKKNSMDIVPTQLVALNTEIKFFLGILFVYCLKQTVHKPEFSAALGSRDFNKGSEH